MIQHMPWNTIEEYLLARKCEGCGTCYTRTTQWNTVFMVGHFGSRPHQAHIASQYIYQLGQFIEFPPSQETSDRREGLVS
jgi:hypothetical protein